MAVSDERLARWAQRRRERLARLGWVHSRTERGRPTRFVTDEILVDDAGAARTRDTLRSLGHARTDVTEFEVSGGLRRIRARGLDVHDAVRRLRAQLPPDVAVGPNHVYLSTATATGQTFLGTPHEHGGPSGPAVPADAPAPLAPDRGRQGPVRVVVMDTGVWRDSPLPRWAYDAAPDTYETDVDADDDGDIDTDVGHANFIAGVIMQRSSHAAVRIVRVLDSFGVCTEAELVQAIDGLDRSDGVDVLNLSLGGFSDDDTPPAPLAGALERFLAGTDRVVVAAAGNDATHDRPFWPAAFAGTGHDWSTRVISVAAHDGVELCGWSNTGPWVRVAAPGADVVSTYVRTSLFATGWALWSGTSFATPYVVAEIADRVTDAGSAASAAAQICDAARARLIGDLPALPVPGDRSHTDDQQ